MRPAQAWERRSAPLPMCFGIPVSFRISVWLPTSSQCSPPTWCGQQRANPPEMEPCSALDHDSSSLASSTTQGRGQAPGRTAPNLSVQRQREADGYMGAPGEPTFPLTLTLSLEDDAGKGFETARVEGSLSEPSWLDPGKSRQLAEGCEEPRAEAVGAPGRAESRDPPDKLAAELSRMSFSVSPDIGPALGSLGPARSTGLAPSGVPAVAEDGRREIVPGAVSSRCRGLLVCSAA